MRKTLLRVLVAYVVILGGSGALRSQFEAAGPPMPRKPFSIAISGSDFTGMIRDVAFARGVPNTRFAVDRVLLVVNKEQIAAVATDGARLCKSTRALVSPEVTPDGTTEMLLPKDINALLDLLAPADSKVRISATDSALVLQAGDKAITLEAATSAGSKTFPDYNRVIPAGSATRATVSAADFKAILKQMGDDLLSPRPTMHLSVARDAPVTITGDHLTNRHYAMAAKVEGPTIEIGCNGDFLSEAADLVRDQPVELGFNAPNAAITIRTGNIVYVVMPVQPPKPVAIAAPHGQ